LRRKVDECKPLPGPHKLVELAPIEGVGFEYSTPPYDVASIMREGRRKEEGGERREEGGGRREDGGERTEERGGRAEER